MRESNTFEATRPRFSLDARDRMSAVDKSPWNSKAAVTPRLLLSPKIFTTT